jgi:type VI secretion system protein ImpJ
VPRWLSGAQNCSLESNGNGNSRYISAIEELQDENTGLDQKPVRVGRKTLRLVLDEDISEGLTTLPLCRIRRDGTGHFAFDPVFVPPVLQISASTRLIAMLGKLVEILESKSEMITVDQQSSAGKFQAAMSPRQVWQFWFLHAINSSLTPLRHLLLTKHGHPEELFREMSRLAGGLCTFGLEVHPRALPSYDHGSPGEAFSALEHHIQHHLEILLPTQAIVIPLKPGARYLYDGEIKDQRSLGPSRWILGISSNMGEADLISRTLQFVKVCSSKFVPELVKRALPGLTLTHLQVPPSAVSAKVDYQYFMISRNGPCWEHIQQTKQVGVYVPGEVPSPTMELIVLLEG